MEKHNRLETQCIEFSQCNDFTTDEVRMVSLERVSPQAHPRSGPPPGFQSCSFQQPQPLRPQACIQARQCSYGSPRFMSFGQTQDERGKAGQPHGEPEKKN
jgi:hypothetical protein